MPVVPMRRTVMSPQAQPDVDPLYLAMAAGTMHQMGTLFEKPQADPSLIPSDAKEVAKDGA